MKTKQSTPHREAAIPGYPALTLHIYGVDKARNLAEDMEQGYYITRAGATVARAELSSDERQAIEAYLTANHPEHAKL